MITEKELVEAITACEQEPLTPSKIATGLHSFAFDFLQSICMEWRKPRGQLQNGNSYPTAVPMESPPFRSAASRSIGSCLCSVVPSYTVEPPVINRCSIRRAHITSHSPNYQRHK